MHQDTQLIQQTRLGDDHAFEPLIDKYHQFISAIVRQWIDSAEDAEEVMQDVFFKVYQHLESLREPTHFKAWLRQIAQHECQNQKRRKQPDFQPLSPDIVANSLPADERLVQHEVVEKVVEAIKSLPAVERELLEARYLYQTGYSQLQAEHNLSYKAVTMRVLRAKRKVQRQIERQFPELVISPTEEAMASATVQSPTYEPKGVPTMRYVYTHPARLFPAHEPGQRKFGYIDSSGKMVIAPQFDRAMGFSEGLARVAIDEKHGFIDDAGEIVIPLQFEWASNFSEKRAPVQANGKYGFIDNHGEIIIEPQFDNVEPFHDGFAAVEVDEKWGFIEKRGKYIAEPQFAQVWPFSGGLAPVTTFENKHGYIDQTGQWVIKW